MQRYYLFILIIGIISCNQTPRQTDLQNDSLIKVTGLDTIHKQDKLKSHSDIELVTKAIDSIYKLKPVKLIQIKYDKNTKFKEMATVSSVNDSGVIITPKPDLMLTRPIFVFDLENTNSLFSYDQFTFLYFNNNESAKRTFLNVFNLFIVNKVTEIKGVNYFYDVFDKGGAWFMYKDNLIIHKYRSCSDNSIENDNEEKLIHYLYNGNGINEKGYFMRYCCSCRQNLQVIYK